MLANLADLYKKSGMSHSDAVKLAEQAMGAGKILERVKDKTSRDIITDQNGLRSPLSQENGFTIKNPSEIEGKPKPFNPFEKK